MPRDMPEGVLHQPPAKRPCGACPYRTDAPSGLWAYSEYQKLRAYDAPTPFQPHAVFSCHEDPDAYRLCAGWVGAHDMRENLAIRLAVSAGAMTIDTLMACIDYVSPVELFKSGLEAMRHGLREYDNPGRRAIKAQDRLRQRRAGTSSEIVDG